MPLCCLGLSRRIPQSIRILGTLTAILLVFLITAILVKVHMDALPFFVITMVKIMLINCKQGWEGTGAKNFPHTPTLPSDHRQPERSPFQTPEKVDAMSNQGSEAWVGRGPGLRVGAERGPLSIKTHWE